MVNQHDIPKFNPKGYKKYIVGSNMDDSSTSNDLDASRSTSSFRSSSSSNVQINIVKVNDYTDQGLVRAQSEGITLGSK